MGSDMRITKVNLQCVVTSLNKGVPTWYAAYAKNGKRYYCREYVNPKYAPKCVREMSENAPLLSRIEFNGETVSRLNGVNNIFEEIERRTT